jgi:hypothetical protein
MLCSNAVRLAQAAGLHRKQIIPREYWTALDAQRNRIWWALYCYEKLLSMRDSRPSCIHDDEYAYSHSLEDSAHTLV